MLTEKQKLLLEVAYDLVNRVSTELCRSIKSGETDDLLYDLMDIMRKILVCTKQEKEGTKE